MGVTNPILSHRKCPCCFDCGECIKSFVIDTDCTIPAIDGIWTTCKTNALASWATLSETPKGLNGDQWVYATDYVTNSGLLGGGGCSWQAAQYCVDNPSGHRGRAWVVDLWLHDDVAGTTVRYSSGQVTDWVCTCDGPRFSWALQSVTSLGCFDRTGDACEDCTGKCLRVTLPALASNPFSPDCGPQPTVTQDVDCIFGTTKIVSAAGTIPDVTTWTIETVCGTGGASDLVLTYDCPTKNPTVITATYRRTGDCFGTYTQISGDTTYLPATLTVADCCSTGTGLVCTDCDGVCVSSAIGAFLTTPSGWVCNLPTAASIEATWVGPSTNVVFSPYEEEPGIVVPVSGWRYRYAIRCISATNRMRLSVTWSCFDSGLNIVGTYDGPVGSCLGTYNLVLETGGGSGWAPLTIVVTAC